MSPETYLDIWHPALVICILFLCGCIVGIGLESVIEVIKKFAQSRHGRLNTHVNIEALRCNSSIIMGLDVL